MSLNPTQKKRATSKFQLHSNDTGSATYQVALLSAKIKKLVSHLKDNPKDKHSRKGLLGMVSQRKKLLSYLKANDEEQYQKVIKELNLKG